MAVYARLTSMRRGRVVNSFVYFMIKLPNRIVGGGWWPIIIQCIIVSFTDVGGTTTTD